MTGIGYKGKGETSITKYLRNLQKSSLIKVSTFAINYRGHPFMESLTDNRPLLYSLAGAGGFVVMLALGE